MAENYSIEAVPVAPLRIAAHKSAAKLACEVDAALVEFRKNDLKILKSKYKDLHYLRDFAPDTFLLRLECPRFGTGEGKGVINESVRGIDEFILCDVTNYSNTYKVCGYINHMSPDDNYQDLKRIIGASVAKAHRVNVIMPFLYESRQHKRQKRESLDCALALEELANMGVRNIITFDAHDPRVQNAIPLVGFDSFMPTHAFLKCMLEKFPDIKIEKDSMMVISPDEGAMGRAVFLANNLGVDMGMFYKRRDFSRVVNGSNPIVAHEFLGSSVAGKTVIIIDDMISSGGSMVDTARQLKERNAARVIVCCTFGLFTNGFDIFDDAYNREIIDLIITTNLNYKPAEIYEKPWFREANLSRYLAAVINSFNYDMTTSTFNDSRRIQNILREREH